MRREIHELRLVQHGENSRGLGVAERAGRRSTPRRGVLGPPPSVVGRPGHPERRACRRDAEPGPTSVTVALRSARWSLASPATPRCFFAPRSGLRHAPRVSAGTRWRAPARRSACRADRGLAARGRASSRSSAQPDRHARVLHARPSDATSTALPAQQRPHRPGGLTSVGFPDDLPLVVQGEAPSCCLGHHFDSCPPEGRLHRAHRPPILTRPRH